MVRNSAELAISISRQSAHGAGLRFSDRARGAGCFEPWGAPAEDQSELGAGGMPESSPLASISKFDVRQ
jgi:hypothetical protein